MSVLAKLVTLPAATPTILATAGPGLSDKKTVLLTAASTAMFIGGSTVDATDGYPIDITTGEARLDLGPGDTLYGFSTAGCTVRVLATRTGATL